MWTVSQMMCMGILIGVSVSDCYFRKIPVDILVMSNAGVFVYQVITKHTDWWLVAGGIGVGVFFLFISKMTGEGLGYGDSWGILILGIYLGLWKLLGVLLVAFVLVAATAILVLSLKKMSRKCALPFLPFLAAGYFFLLMGEAGV